MFYTTGLIFTKDRMNRLHSRSTKNRDLCHRAKGEISIKSYYTKTQMHSNKTTHHLLLLVKEPSLRLSLRLLQEWIEKCLSNLIYRKPTQNIAQWLQETMFQIPVGKTKFPL